MSSSINRYFSLNHTFSNVSTLKDEYGFLENHYGFNCRLNLERKDDEAKVYLFLCPDQEKGWEVQTEVCFEIVSPMGPIYRKVHFYNFKIKHFSGCKNCIDWAELIEKYVKDDKIEVKCHVIIQKVTGLDKKPPLALFNESMKKFSDVVINVGGQKFHVLKLTLARYSPYFEAMFLGNFEESEKSEVELKGVDPQDFQDYLELLHMQSPISDSNVEALLEFVDFHETPLVTEKCVEHLMSDKFKLSRQDKVRLASRFNQKKLLDFCLNECKTVEDLCRMMVADDTAFDMRALKKALNKIAESVPKDLILI